ncbi:MAG: aldehyde dehydrogenase family protein [Spirochaetaceae bacterium]|jgi:succinate-semialdehyde dehydrogenase/glutarate-semialdehyde dehydrogenase|nr:aldehyde dehydrogenase family protein [Spirochaetaceae bacterium]
MTTKENLPQVIAAARDAQVLWNDYPFSKKAACLKAARAFMAGHIDEIAQTIHKDNGKLLIDALSAEALPAFMAMDYYLKHAKKFMRDKKLGMGSILMFNKKSRIVYRPIGVVGIISPWNYPFAIPFSEVVMALLAGNAVILKTASVTTGVGRLLESIFNAAGLPAGLFSYCEIPGAEAGSAFIEGGIDKLFFTGSTKTGKELMALAAPRLLPLVLELGGADAAIVCADADISRAAKGLLWAGYSNAGQICGGVQRILVHKSIYKKFLAEFCRLVSALRPGNGLDADFGPMTTMKQKEAVEKLIQDCIEGGAVVAAKNADFQGDSEADNKDKFLNAVVLTAEGLDKDKVMALPVMEDEIFGPVTIVLPFTDEGEAASIANASSYALTSSVWSKDRRRALNLARQLNAGAIMINDHLMSHGLAETSWGGPGGASDSGLGRTHGELGFMEMLKTEFVVDDFLPGVRRDIYWHPYSAKVYEQMRALTAFLAGVKPLSQIPKVLSLVMRYWKK